MKCTGMHDITHLVQIFFQWHDNCRSSKTREQGGRNTVSALMFADDFVGMSETPAGFVEPIVKALEYSKKWMETAKVNKCATIVFDDDKEDLVYLK